MIFVLTDRRQKKKKRRSDVNFKFFDILFRFKQHTSVLCLDSYIYFSALFYDFKFLFHSITTPEQILAAREALDKLRTLMILN